MVNIISIKNFTKKFDKLVAVDDLSLEISQGETFAFLGSNGSGKTTTFRCLLDIYHPTSGELLINGKPYSKDLNHTIGYLPEERGLYTKVKVFELLTYIIKLRGFSQNDAKTKAQNYLDRVGLSGSEQKLVSQLSSGMQQKLQLGVALIHEPEILILDEPFKGLDPVNRQMFIDILSEYKQNGTTIIYSTHVIDEAQKLADRLAIIKDGKRIEYGTISEVREAHGSNSIHIEFTGKLDYKGALFDYKVDNNLAEITPKGKTTSREVLEYLAKDKNIKVMSFKIDAPSLNQVFIIINS